MSYLERKSIYKKIEKIRKRPLIAYVTSIRPGQNVQMATDIIPFLIEQVNQIKDTDSIDILILSNGGDPIVSWRIISILREKFKHIGVLIPYTAYSAATLLALGADEIIMHPYANLGPLDPQLSFPDTNGKQKMIGYEDIVKYIDFVKDISHNEPTVITDALDKLTKELSPTMIGFAKRSSTLGLTMCQKLLETHMTDNNKIKAIVDSLNNNYYHHGYPVSRKEALNLGLPIAKSNTEIEDLLWKLYKNYADEMHFNIPHNPELMIMNEIESHPLKPNEINTLKLKNKIASIESINMNSYIAEEIIARYQLNNDMSLTSHINIKPGIWQTEKDN